MTAAGFEPIDFRAYHEHELPRHVANGRGALAAKALARLGSLAFRLPDGAAWTYRLEPGGVSLHEGDAGADTVIELDREAWEGLAHDYESAPGLLYGGRVRCTRGKAMQLVLWEPALRALYQGRPVYDADEPLLDRDGRALDPARSFMPDANADEMAHFLRTTGYLFVRGLFASSEVDGFLREAEELRREAVKGDRLSWWAKDAAGDEILCRVTRAREKPLLGTLFGTERLARLVALADPTLVPRTGEGSGVTVIFKNPGVTEGLSDLPWHRDCGMGGHAVMCPVVICSLYLTPAARDGRARVPAGLVAAFVRLPRRERRSAARGALPRTAGRRVRALRRRDARCAAAARDGPVRLPHQRGHGLRAARVAASSRREELQRRAPPARGRADRAPEPRRRSRALKTHEPATRTRL